MKLKMAKWVQSNGYFLLLGFIFFIQVSMATDDLTTKTFDWSSIEGCICISSKNCDSQHNSMKCIGNNISHIPKSIRHYIHRMNIEEFRVTELTRDVFENFINLKVLRISNSEIDSISDFAFADLMELEEINLSNNRIKSLSPISFQSLQNLKVLVLQNNPLGDLPCGLFSTLEKLEYLNLENTQLDNMCPELFYFLTNLKVLILNSNNLNYVTHMWWNTLSHLKYLGLSHNKLRNLSSTSFTILHALQQLNLSWNLIDEISPNSFTPLHDLITLDLSGNNLEMLDVPLFSSKSKLRDLTLCHMNKLSYVGDDALDNLSILQKLKLCYNTDLTMIGNSLFSATKHLQYLDISYNSLSSLPDSITELKSLHKVISTGNPWSCHCNLVWLESWLSPLTEIECLNEESDIVKPVLLNVLTFLQQNCSSWNIIDGSGILYFRPGSSALLECNATFKAQSLITWVTPQNEVFTWQYASGDDITQNASSNSTQVQKEVNPRITLLHKGSLFIHKVLYTDRGRYSCSSSNSLWNVTSYVTLQLDGRILLEVKLMSLLVGLITGIIFLIIMMIATLSSKIVDRYGCCPCCMKNRVPKNKHLRHVLFTLENYRTEQLERLRENYQSQVQKIKDNFVGQVERIRDSYSSQVQHLRDFRDYGTQTLTGYRGQYTDQVKRVRSYSVHQLSRVRENYICQRNKVRKFSAHQFLRLRETYKFQQQTVIKIIENLPMLYLDNCRTGMCQRTDSVVLDYDVNNDDSLEVDGELRFITQIQTTALVNVNDDSGSMSDYYTPTETNTPLNN